MTHKGCGGKIKETAHDDGDGRVDVEWNCAKCGAGGWEPSSELEEEDCNE